MTLFLKVLALVFVAELGDKTQLMMIAMSSKFRIRDILVGVAFAVAALNFLAVVAGSLLGGMLPMTAINIIAGAAFLYFAYTALADNGDGEHEVDKKGKRRNIITVFGTFFLAELGDKTQLTALTLAADSGSGGLDPVAELTVFAASSVALFAADVLGLAVGCLLGKKLPEDVFSWISFGIFAAFGALKLLGAFEVIFYRTAHAVLFAVLSTCAVCIVFAAACAVRIARKFRKKPYYERNAKNIESV
ncbi:MAG: TMEM165/GDT1 family protein [Eubacteriales bacterium]